MKTKQNVCHSVRECAENKSDKRYTGVLEKSTQNDQLKELASQIWIGLSLNEIGSKNPWLWNRIHSNLNLAHLQFKFKLWLQGLVNIS